MRVVALTFALSASTATALGALRSNVFLSSDMKPDMVAQSLQTVEGEWKAQAHVSAECKTQGELPTCAEAPRAFHSSCSKVVRAVMMGSQGDSVKVSEYMTSVCSQKTISGWQQSCCGFIGTSIVAKMSDNAAENRQNYVAKADATCNSLWIRFVEEQSAQVAIEAQAKVDARMKASQALREKAKLAEAKLLHEMATKTKESIPLPMIPTRAEASKKAEAAREEKAKVQDAAKKGGEKALAKTIDAVENNIADAFKAHPKIQEAGKKVGAKVKTTDAVENNIKNAFKSHPKIQEAGKKVHEKAKSTESVETNILSAFKGAVALLR